MTYTPICKAFAVFLMASLSVVAEDFTIDKAHSGVAFSISHLSISKVRGRFKTFEGGWSISQNTRKLAKLEVTVEVSSVDTDNTDRDDHLRNEDFFDAKKHPRMTFKMSKYKETSPGKGKVIGQLTIRGKTLPVELDAEVSNVVENPWKKGKKKTGLALTGTISRLDFGVGKKYGNAKIGEKTTIQIDLEGDN